MLNYVENVQIESNFPAISWRWAARLNVIVQLREKSLVDWQTFCPKLLGERNIKVLSVD